MLLEKEIDLNSMVELNNGVLMPRLGFGTWKLSGSSALRPVQWALKIGYRSIDTASIYANEKYVGRAIKESGIPREDIFVTSKVWNTEQGYHDTLKAFDYSLKRLNLNYLDLYLIHWPVGLNNETWEALEVMYDEGKVRAIGISNFSLTALKELVNNHYVIPAVHQIILSPLNYTFENDMTEYCLKKNIAIEVYHSLTNVNDLHHELLWEIADKYNKSISQILIRWSLQRGFICIPRSKDKEHIKQNVDIFDFQIHNEDMLLIDSI